ncbi:NAD(P)/FAD-dependent oxidoreductase [Hymenobacter latericus]|uniref:NAD(P)/FAD-dependent oxidoreductase n=1 Tax=Hymenobacter sp. YIM 151858-1 TaxID=2987688 RepID=UPI0022261DED|nr:FAD-binding oxidoreductase [Hymenobacter sp. YIM 151858-1]UYZ58461.1 FAD-binding oxidoreductase [Hymenobacter sp. YIM 151858-1]
MATLLSYWEKQSFLQGFDVAVVGAGLVGLTAAVFTKRLRPRARVVVLERDVLPNGASTKNAGFACFGSVSELIEQEKRGGTAALLSVVQYRWEGLRLLRELLGDEAIGYEALGGFELFREQEAALAAQCREHLGYYNALLAPIIGESEIFRVADHKLPDFGFAGVHSMLENVAEGALDTGRMMHALLRLAWQEGVTILHGVPVTAIDAGATTVKLKTPLAQVEAGQVLLATNAFSRTFFPDLDVVPGRGQVLVTAPVPGLNLPGTFHYDKGYYYFRPVAGNRLLLGGGRNLDFAAEATTEPGLTPLVQQRLEQLLREVILPGRNVEVEHRWSGVMGFGQELEPFIGDLAPGVYGALRCNGMGVAMGTRSGQRAAELLLN